MHPKTLWTVLNDVALLLEEHNPNRVATLFNHSDAFGDRTFNPTTSFAHTRRLGGCIGSIQQPGARGLTSRPSSRPALWGGRGKLAGTARLPVTAAASDDVVACEVTRPNQAIPLWIDGHPNVIQKW